MQEIIITNNIYLAVQNFNTIIYHLTATEYVASKYNLRNYLNLKGKIVSLIVINELQSILDT